MSDFYLIAEIKKIFSEDGFVQIKSYSDFPERFFELNKVFIEVFGNKKKFIVEDVQQHKSNFLLKFKGFSSAESIDFLIGAKVFVDETDVVKPDESTFFIHDLIGSDVYYRGEFFGKLNDVLQLPANDVYVVNHEQNGESLVPALKSTIDKFDAENKKLYLNDEFEFEYDED